LVGGDGFEPPTLSV